MSQSRNQSFKVFIRCRPLNEKEASCFLNKKSVSIIQPSSVSLVDIDNRQTLYNYDGVFTETTTTQSIFQNSVQPVINHFINGYNSTVFAYGITGAGKSFTMFGNQDQFGLIPMTINSILTKLQNEKWNLKMSYIQIYNQQIFDLLVEKSDNLQVVEDPQKGVIVMDVQEREIKHFQQAHLYINEGNTRRVMAQTYANDFSSRSHAIVLLTLERYVDDKIVMAKMSLVDLAGSEKATVYTGQNKGANRLQGSNINKSLLALGNCIMILSENPKKGAFVPYRDSKLTRLLKDSLGGNTKTVMIACISQSPLCYDQTLSTLKYAGRARRIQKIVVQNTKQSNFYNYQQLKQQYQKIKKQNQMLKMAQSKFIPDKKCQTIKIKNLLNNLIGIVRKQTLTQTSDKLDSAQNRSNSHFTKNSQQKQLVIQQIMKVIMGETEQRIPNQYVHQQKPNTSIENQNNQRSKTISKYMSSSSKQEPLFALQLSSLNHVRSHRKRNSVIKSQQMCNTLNFLKTITNIEQSNEQEYQQICLTKSQSFQVSKQIVHGRKSKHLNILKEIQDMSKKLLAISNSKKPVNPNTMADVQQRQVQNYTQEQII